MNSEARSYVSGPEQSQTARALLDWLNQYDQFPAPVGRIEAEYLAAGASMALFSAAAPYKVREYINGAYDAQYQFAVRYRTAAANSQQRLAAMEALNRLAQWSEERDCLPDLGPGRSARSVERSSPAVMSARYDDGMEDYQILMVMDYQVGK